MMDRLRPHANEEFRQARVYRVHQVEIMSGGDSVGRGVRVAAAIAAHILCEEGHLSIQALDDIEAGDYFHLSESTKFWNLAFDVAMALDRHSSSERARLAASVVSAAFQFDVARRVGDLNGAAQSVLTIGWVSGRWSVAESDLHEVAGTGRAVLSTLEDLRERRSEKAAAWRVPLEEFCDGWLAKHGVPTDADGAPKTYGLTPKILAQFRAENAELVLPGSDGPNGLVGARIRHFLEQTGK